MTPSSTNACYSQWASVSSLLEKNEYIVGGVEAWLHYVSFTLMET